MRVKLKQPKIQSYFTRFSWFAFPSPILYMPFKPHSQLCGLCFGKHMQFDVDAMAYSLSQL